MLVTPTRDTRKTHVARLVMTCSVSRVKNVLTF